MKEGVFWIIPQSAQIQSNNFEIITVFNGILGHSDIWKSVVSNRKEFSRYEYDFFPRGRVWIKDGKATIFLNPTINLPAILQKVIELFDLGDNYVVCEDL